MAGKRTEMSKIKQILLLHKDGMSNRKIGERLGLYKETVNKYVNAAKSDSKSIEELIKMEEPELQHRFSAGNAAYSDKRFDAQEDLEYYVRELERRHVTMYLLWEEYRQKHPDGYGYTQFCYHLNQHKASAAPEVSLPKSNFREGGNELFIDFAGDTMSYVDLDTGGRSQMPDLRCMPPGIRLRLCDGRTKPEGGRLPPCALQLSQTYRRRPQDTCHRQSEIFCRKA